MSIERPGNTSAEVFSKLLKMQDNLARIVRMKEVCVEKLAILLKAGRYFDAAPRSVEISSTLESRHNLCFVFPRP
jgi:hypothetical protein